MENAITPQKTILDHFLHWEETRGDQVFLRQPQGESWLDITWAEAGEAARRMARALQDLGLQPGDKIGILSKNCYHWILADLAIMMGNFVSTPFYPNLTAEQLQEVIELSDARALFVGKLEAWEQMGSQLPEELLTIAFPHYPGNAVVNARYDWDALVENTPPLEEIVRPALDDLWTILFTSGTTGTPKGVMHVYRAPSAILENERQHGNLGIFQLPAHRFFSYLPLNHIAERVIVEVAALMTGGTIYFAESLDTFAQNLQAAQPTLFMAVPRIWTKFRLAILAKIPPPVFNLLLRTPGINSFLRKKIKKGLGLMHSGINLTGAAPTPDDLKDWYLKLGIRIREVYAMTENCGGCTLMPTEQLKSGTVGTVLPNAEIAIEPDTGEILMRAPWVMLGYYKDPGLTEKVLREGWLHTGDQGEIDEQGFLKITGRVVDTFKSSKGKFIVPAPLEWGFARNHLIEQVCVVGQNLPQPIALLNLSELGQGKSAGEVSRSLEATLEVVNSHTDRSNQVQSLVILPETWSIENGLLTPTLKIRRSVLQDRYAPRMLGWYRQKKSIIWEKNMAE